MIIGGHGAVGQTISKALRKHPLIIAGRNTDTIQKFIDRNLENAIARKIDIKVFDAADFNDVHTIIVCMDQDSTELVEYCVANDLNYMDVSANSTYLDQVQRLDFTNQSSILLGVGIAPGVTNILASELVKTYPDETNIAIHVILGLGEKHGRAAIDWTLNNMILPYSHSEKPYKPFMKHSCFNHLSKRYDAYNFNFADQYLLQYKYPDFNFITYMGFDKPFATRSIHRLVNMNAMNFLKTKKGYDITHKMLKNPKFGSDKFIIHVTNGTNELVFDGYNEAYYTGLFAAHSAVKLVETNPPHGLIGMDDILSYKDLFEIETA